MERENISPFKVTHVQRWYVQMNEPECQNPEFVERVGGSTAVAPESTPEEPGSEDT